MNTYLTHELLLFVSDVRIVQQVSEMRNEELDFVTIIWAPLGQWAPTVPYVCWQIALTSLSKPESSSTFPPW